MDISQRHLGPVVKPALRHSSAVRRIAAGLLAWCATGAASFAQSTPPRHCWFTVFEAAGDPPADVLFESSEHKVQPLAFDAQQRSEVYEYKGPNTLSFFRQTPAPPTAPNGTPPTRNLFSSVDLPAQGDHFLILFLPEYFDQKNKQPVTYVLDDGPDAFPFGSVRLFNATKNNLAGQVGDQRLPVLPGAGEALPQGKGGSLNVALAIYYEGKARLSFANNIRVKRGARTLLILVPSLSTGSVKINLHTLVEMPDAAKPNLQTTNPENVAQAN